MIRAFSPRAKDDQRRRGRRCAAGGRDRTVAGQNVLSLWRLWLPRPDGRFDDWGRSALEAAAMAMENWVRVKPKLGAYECEEAKVPLSPPIWPKNSFHE